LTKNTNLKRLFGLRKKLLLKTLNESSADMFCLQEMSADSYIMMADWIKSYAFASEIPYLNNGTRNRSVDVYFVSRYRPKSITIYGLQGVLNYKNALMVIEYPNLVIYNLYNQAGSKVSIGQEKTWIHYSRCRYDILNIIYDVMPKNQNIAICGDFNFHLDGSEDDWPEIDMINRFKNAGFIDTYRSIHNVGGLTEDTDANPMRWNQKLVSKKYRYDAILYKGSTKGWDVNSSRILGTEKSWLNEADSEWFYNELSEAKKKTNGLQRLKAKRITKKGYRLPLNPSDHFGVLTKFKMPIKRWVTRKIQTK
jgi:exonuclease III